MNSNKNRDKSEQKQKNSKLLKASIVAAMLDVSEDTLNRWRQRGTGPKFCKFARNRQAIVRYRLEDVEAFIEASLRCSTSDSGPDHAAL